MSKDKLIKVAAKLLTTCPVSTFIEDLGLINIQKKNSVKIQYKLDELDKWLKDIAVEIRSIADENT